MRGRSDTSSDRLAPFTPTGQGTKNSQIIRPVNHHKQEVGSETQATHSFVFIVHSAFDCLGDALVRLTEGSTEQCRDTP